LWLNIPLCFIGDSKVSPHDVKEMSSDKLTCAEGGVVTLTGVLSKEEELSSIMFKKGSGAESLCLVPIEEDVASEKLRSIREDNEGVGDGVLGGRVCIELDGTGNEFKLCGITDNKFEARVIPPRCWFADITGDGILICGGEDVSMCEFVTVCVTVTAEVGTGARTSVAVFPCTGRPGRPGTPVHELKIIGLGVIIKFGLVLRFAVATLIVCTGCKSEDCIGFKTCLPTNLLFIRLRFCLPRRLENFGKYCPICWLNVELTGVGFTAGAGASGLRNSASCSKGTARGPSGLSAAVSDNSCLATPPPRPAAIMIPRLTGLERDVTAGEVGEPAGALMLGLQVDVLLLRPLPLPLVS